MAEEKKNAAIEEEEAEFITLEFEDGTEVEAEIMGIFDVDGKEYIALIPDDDSDDVYLYGYKEVDDEEFEHHSRIPVYAESPEYITGYILRDDALEDLAEDKFGKTLKDIRRDISFFNEETPLGEIWEKLLRGKEQIALIIDEYGCFQGILTLEDIIETIFGLEIMDENDEVSDMQKLAKERWEKRQKRYRKVQIPKKEENR